MVARKKKSAFSLAAIDAVGAGAVPEPYRAAMQNLIAAKPFLGMHVCHARSNLAQAVAEERLGAPVMTSPFPFLLPSGRILAALQAGGADECLKLARFDVGGAVEYAEFPGVWRAQYYNAGFDADRVVWVEKNGDLVEGTFATSTYRVIWRPDAARMSSYSYDYTDPDRLLLVIGLRAGGCVAQLIERRDEQFEVVASSNDADCETVEVVPPFAFLVDAKGKKGKIFATQGAKLIDLGPFAFPKKLQYPTELDGQFVSCGDSEMFRIDGLQEAYRAAT